MIKQGGISIAASLLGGLLALRIVYIIFFKGKNVDLITFFNENGKVDIYKWLNELELVADKNKPLILICRSGRRTGIVSDYLDKYFEFIKIYDATDGIKEWKKNKFRDRKNSKTSRRCSNSKMWRNSCFGNSCRSEKSKSRCRLFPTVC